MNAKIKLALVFFWNIPKALIFNFIYFSFFTALKFLVSLCGVALFGRRHSLISTDVHIGASMARFLSLSIYIDSPYNISLGDTCVVFNQDIACLK